MSSSKVFKEDTLFTPHSLVRQRIDPPVHKAAQAVAPEPKPDPVEMVLDQDAQPDVPPQEAAHPPEAQQPPRPAPAPQKPASPPPKPEPPPQPAVDIEAIRQEGYNLGAADTAKRMQAKFDQCMQSFVEACQKIDNLHSERLASSHADMVNLVISLTEKILDHELSTARNEIALTLETALEQAIASEEFHVTLHPEDLAFAEERAPTLINSIRSLEHLVFKADPGVRRGGCLLESITCTVDATIDGKLESAREFLKDHPELLLPTDDERGQGESNSSDSGEKTPR
nr:FliH/SctL family protein [uncultured Desulfobulbus sp.]